jgi:hypothetical protein
MKKLFKIILVALSIVSSSLLADESYIKTCHIISAENIMFPNEVLELPKDKSITDIKLMFNKGKLKGNLDDTVIIKGSNFESHGWMLSPRGNVDIFSTVTKEKHPSAKQAYAIGILPEGGLVIVSALAVLRYKCE